jgi:phosphodiesterase/alkaline phosphatase D-like protein
MPVVTGEPATSVQATRAVLNATVNPGFGDTRFFFQYGKSTDYETVTAPGASVGEDHAVHGVATQIEGLDPGTTYHYRVIAFNFSGTTKGPNQVFVTPDVPGVTSTSASSVTSSSAQLNALVVPNSRATTVHFEFGTPTYGQVGLYSVSTPETASIGADTAPHPVSAAAAGLQPATTYNFRVVATNSEGITYGPNQTFTTGPAAVPIEPLTCKRGQVKRKGRCVNRKCKRGQVKRKGKCVKRKRAVRRASKRRSRDRG